MAYCTAIANCAQHRIDYGDDKKTCIILSGKENVNPDGFFTRWQGQEMKLKKNTENTW